MLLHVASSCYLSNNAEVFFWLIYTLCCLAHCASDYPCIVFHTSSLTIPCTCCFCDVFKYVCQFEFFTGCVLDSIFCLMHGIFLSICSVMRVILVHCQMMMFWILPLNWCLAISSHYFLLFQALHHCFSERARLAFLFWHFPFWTDGDALVWKDISIITKRKKKTKKKDKERDAPTAFILLFISCSFFHCYCLSQKVIVCYLYFYSPGFHLV